MGMDRRFTPFVDGHITTRTVQYKHALPCLISGQGSQRLILYTYTYGNTAQVCDMLYWSCCKIYIHVPPSASRVQCAYHQAENRA